MPGACLGGTDKWPVQLSGGVRTQSGRRRRRRRHGCGWRCVRPAARSLLCASAEPLLHCGPVRTWRRALDAWCCLRPQEPADAAGGPVRQRLHQRAMTPRIGREAPRVAPWRAAAGRRVQVGLCARRWRAGPAWGRARGRGRLRWVRGVFTHRAATHIAALAVGTWDCSHTVLFRPHTWIIHSRSSY